MKKILIGSLLLILILALILIVGRCTSNKTNKVENETEEKETIVIEKDDEEEDLDEQEDVVAKEDKKEPEVPENKEEKEEVPQSTEWKNTYLKYIVDNKEEFLGYALIYIDDDDVPELYLTGNSEATGDVICSYKNGKFIEQQLNRINGGSYLPKTGLIFNFNGNMGYYTANVYRLNNDGFSEILTGIQQERIIEDENCYYYIEYDYYIEKIMVDEEGFYNAIHAVFDTSKSKSFYESKVSYSTIIQQIENAK